MQYCAQLHGDPLNHDFGATYTLGLPGSVSIFPIIGAPAHPFLSPGTMATVKKRKSLYFALLEQEKKKKTASKRGR